MKYKEYLDYAIDMIEKLVNIPSPSGFTRNAMKFMKAEAEKLGYKGRIENTGCLVIDVPGKIADNECRNNIVGITSQDVLCLAAHVDTLGAMVSAIKPSGYLRFSSIGGFTMQGIEGEYCRIHTRSNGKTFTGTVLTTQPSVHVYDDARTQERSLKNMEIRLDEKVFSAEDVRNLGIEVGDYVSFEPRFEHTESGFIKSRHLDDKASAGIIWSILKYMSDHHLAPVYDIKVMLTGFEELGYGASWLPEGVTKMLAVDMGAVGADLNGDEFHVSICAKDSTGPYNYEMTNELIALAKKKNLAYAIDVFPHYGSDIGSAMRGGNQIAGALIGQGVHASHGMERTHEEGLYNTLLLVMAYIGLE